MLQLPRLDSRSIEGPTHPSMYEIVKTLALFVYPLGLGLALCLLSLFLLSVFSRRAGLLSLFLAIGLIWAFSMPVVADRLLAALEAEWPDVPVEQLPVADAVLVLGGAFSTGNGQFNYPSAGGGVDRYWHATRIWHAGRAPRLILSGGRQPHRTAGRTEAEAGALFLMDMGLPPEALILETRALTTRGHTVELKTILADYEISSLIVVTSASHMRRSLATLAELDVSIVPAATGFSVYPQPRFRLRRFLPSVGALSRSTRATHEFIGLWYYRLRGFV